MALFGRKRPTIDDVTVSLDGWHISERTAQITQYDHPNGDVFSVNFFDRQPDIGTPLSDIVGIRNFYRQMLIPNNMGLIECDVVDFAGVSAVYLLAKLQLERRGFLFVGSYTLPRRDQSYVLKYQAVESGVTGMREAAIMAMLPPADFDEITNRIVGWCSDPYDDALDYPVMRNKADAAKYDDQFSDHPLSRTRCFMANLADCVTISDRLRGMAEFNP